ncbi:hypothetical protein I3760_05G200700 [Carya illinoinensis]|nr:hypothetical protein I3760_05G200700 [Carya illinoinensis]
MQQSPQMLNGTPSMLPTANITTEQIQKYLDENKELIMAIIENQNLGKFSECPPYHAQLQQNLTYLAKIADAQPQVQTIPSQMPPHSAVQQGHAMHHPRATMSQQQEGPFAPKSPFQLDDQPQHQHQQQAHYLQQQQFIQGQMGVRPGGTSSMYQAMQSSFGYNLFGMQGSKQDSSEASAGDFLGRLASKPNGNTE